MITSDYLMYVGAGAVVALIGWLFLNSRGRRDNEKRIPQFYFTRMGSFRLMEALSVAGVMLPEIGGQKEDPACVVLYRSGRLWGTPKGRDPGTMRQRRAVYVARQDDAAVLNLSGLFDGSPVYGRVTESEIKARKSLAARQAMAEAVRKPGTRDLLTRRLSLAAIFSVGIGAISWLALTLAVTFGA